MAFINPVMPTLSDPTKAGLAFNVPRAQPITPNTAAAQATPGLIGGSVAGTTAEMERTAAAEVRGRAETARGVSATDQMRGISQGLTASGASAAGTQEGYLGNAQGDSALSGADRARAQQDLDRVRAFYEKGPGPSAAQAQLRQANDINNSATVSLARSGRGGVNPLASRDASFAQANAGQEMNRNSKILGAQEAADWRTQQGQAMGLEQAGLGAMRTGDLGTMAGNLQGGMDYGNQGLGYGKLGAATTEQGQNIGLGYTGLAETAAQNAEKLRADYLAALSRGEVSETTTRMGYNTAMNALNQQQTAGMIGAAGTAGAGLVDTIFNHKSSDSGGGAFDPKKTGEYMDAFPDSDIRLKRNIIPMPENY